LEQLQHVRSDCLYSHSIDQLVISSAEKCRAIPVPNIFWDSLVYKYHLTLLTAFLVGYISSSPSNGIIIEPFSCFAEE